MPPKKRASKKEPELEVIPEVIQEVNPPVVMKNENTQEVSKEPTNDKVNPSEVKTTEQNPENNLTEFVEPLKQACTIIDEAVKPTMTPNVGGGSGIPVNTINEYIKLIKACKDKYEIMLIKYSKKIDECDSLKQEIQELKEAIEEYQNEDEEDNDEEEEDENEEEEHHQIPTLDEIKAVRPLTNRDIRNQPGYLKPFKNATIPGSIPPEYTKVKQPQTIEQSNYEAIRRTMEKESEELNKRIQDEFAKNKRDNEKKMQKAEKTVMVKTKVKQDKKSNY